MAEKYIHGVQYQTADGNLGWIEVVVGAKTLLRADAKRILEGVIAGDGLQILDVTLLKSLDTDATAGE
jgi:hypothetical protein